MTDNDNRNGGVQKGHAWREFALAPEMVQLPSGNYLMGENEEDKFANATERPRHRVEINYELAICRYPITQGEFYAFDGGAWDYLPRLLRSTWRDSLLQTIRRDNVGFRVALTL